MANYYANARTNYFKVKDIEAFKTAIEDYPLEVVSRDDNPEFVALFVADTGDDGAFPWCDFYTDDADGDEIDWTAIFKRHLQENSVVIIQEVGNEKQRYFGGIAVAINSKGEEIIIDINSIFDQALSLGEVIDFWGNTIKPKEAN
jgi:hypothetical protein